MTRTNAYSLVVILIRIGALYMAMRGLASLAPLVFTHYWSELAPFAISAGILLLLGAAVWVCADLIARAALASPREPVFESDLDAGQWQYVLFSVVGLWWVVTAIVSLVWSIVGWWQVLNYAEGSRTLIEFGAGRFADVVASLVQLAIGIALLLGSRGLVRLLRRLRGHE